MQDPRPAMQEALKQAMREKNVQRRDTIRAAMSAFKQVEIDTREELAVADAISILQKEIKKFQETIQDFENAGRTEETAELQQQAEILAEFLPQQLSREEIEAIAQEIITQTGASSPQEMGKVMGAMMPRIKGKADGKLVNQVVRELLSES